MIIFFNIEIHFVVKLWKCCLKNMKYTENIEVRIDYSYPPCNILLFAYADPLNNLFYRNDSCFGDFFEVLVGALLAK